MSNVSEAFANASHLDQEALKAFDHGLDKVDQSAFTYLHFRRATQRLLASGLSAKQAMESVFITAEAIGIDRSQLLRSTELYLQALDQEKAKIDRAFQNRVNEGLAIQEKAIQKEAEQIKNLENSIQELKARLESSRQKHTELLENLAAERDRLEERAELLQQAYQNLKSEMSADLAQMREA